ncbi:unnamed protein product [marine sediment metagenome]|uniref:Uncharacterized protein n=1 Tax=marine sediment metagenome TaxID=412755 RepID=X0S6C9_9ZZZZ
MPQLLQQCSVDMRVIDYDRMGTLRTQTAGNSAQILIHQEERVRGAGVRKQ